MGTGEIITIKTEVDKTGLEEGLGRMKEAATKGAKVVTGELEIATKAMDELSKRSKTTGTDMERSMNIAKRSMEGFKPQDIAVGFQTLGIAAQGETI